MNTGFLTHSDNFLQSVIFTQSQCNCNLIQPVCRKYHRKICNSSDNLDSIINSSCRNIIIKDSSDNITPLWILLNSVNIFFRCPAVTYQYHLLLIQSALSHFSQHGENKEPYSPFCKDVNHTENVNRQSGEIRLSHHIQTEYDQQKSEYICLDDICQNQSAPLHIQRLI